MVHPRKVVHPGDPDPHHLLATAAPPSHSRDGAQAYGLGDGGLDGALRCGEGLGYGRGERQCTGAEPGTFLCHLQHLIDTCRRTKAFKDVRTATSTSSNAVGGRGGSIVAFWYRVAPSVSSALSPVRPTVVDGAGAGGRKKLLILGCSDFCAGKAWDPHPV